MANHRRPSKKKLAPSIVLLLSVASVTSPLALLFTTEEKATPSSPIPVPQFAPDMPKVNAAAVLEKAKRVAPTYTAVQSPASTRLSAQAPIQPTTSVQRTRSQTSATTRTTVSSTPAAPERQRATQRAPSSTLTAVRHPPSTSATPIPAKAPPSTVAKAVPKQVPTTPKATPKPTPTPIPTKTIEKTTDPPKAPSPPSPPSPSHQLLVQIAQKYVNRGIPYQMGGNSLSGGMDCSHFVWMVLKEAGYNVQYRDSAGLASWTKRVSDPQPGDLVLFQGHVGIYVSSGMMIDQGSSGGAHLREIKYYHNFIGYGRLPI